MNRKCNLFLIITAVVLTTCSAAAVAQGGKLPLNLIPMYGYPDIEKPEALKKVDEEFIRNVVDGGSREEASRRFAGEAWNLFRKGDGANAMRRFNQAWLLNPDNYQPYWGFGALLFAQKRPSEAVVHYEKALSLISEASEKPRLLSDVGRAYSMLGFAESDPAKSGDLFAKSHALFGEAIKLDPQYANAYRNWAMSLYVQENYKMAWEIVRKSRELNREVFPPGFIDALSKKLPEPK
jgi:tetratricopeptide (TPR) repeat protein